MSYSPCELCGGPIPLEWERCPHCARPGLYPNVKEAKSEPRQKELQERYQAALQEATRRGAGEVVRAFEQAVRDARAVIARPLRDFDRITSSDRELFATFYGLTEGEVRLPFGDKWDRLRRLADEALFPGYKQHIRFAALSLNGVGLSEFGECSMVLRDDMIGHRASVFEDNSASLMEKSSYKEPPGCRAVWDERSKLCAAKLGGELQPETPPAEFPHLLLRQGTEHEESRFVEVHIWGSMSVRSVERVILTYGSKRKPRKAFELALRDQAARVGLKLEVA